MTRRMAFVGLMILLWIPHAFAQHALPVGTVIASILPWEIFANTVGDDVAIKPNKNTWVPCDSSSILGSELERLTGLPNAPDFRGVFLRGLNRFAAREPSPVPNQQADPDNRTKAGEFQAGQVGKHEHKYRGGSVAGTGYARDDDHDVHHVWHGGDPKQNMERETEKGPKGEVRPGNMSVFYYIKIN